MCWQRGNYVAHGRRNRKATHRLPRGGKDSWSPPTHEMGKEMPGKGRTAMDGVKAELERHRGLIERTTSDRVKAG